VDAATLAGVPQTSPLPLLHPDADLKRIARRLLGRSVALVLGGGGARGVAHLGILKAFEEYGIPVDIVGGTSIGAFVGAVYSSNLTWQKTYAIVRNLGRQLSPRHFLLDLTYPWISMTTGRKFNRLIRDTFQDLDIEDHWIEYYCSVTNLSRQASSQVCSRGTAWDVIRASMSVVGFVPPLWRNNELLLDGCYSSNVPVSYAVQLRANTIFAIDVGLDNSVSAASWRNWGTELSAWSMMVRRFLAPDRSDPPSYSWVVEFLTEAMSKADLRITKEMENCHYTRVPVGMFRAKDFASFDAIYEVGYQHAVQWLAELKGAGKLDKLLSPSAGNGCPQSA
jgi:predicted acylesterase/phospholipase RssA